MLSNSVKTLESNLDTEYNLKPISSRKNRDSLLKMGSDPAATSETTKLNSPSSMSVCDRIDDDNPMVGYISVKDFAYDDGNPLHYGYFDDKDIIDEPETQNVYLETVPSTSEAIDNNDLNDSSRRQSVVLPNDYIVNQKAIALYDFEPENDNELELKEGDVVFISYRHGQGWLVAENSKRTKTGLVPEEFVSFLEGNLQANGEPQEADQDDDVLRPFYLTEFISRGLKPNGTNEIYDNETHHDNDNNKQYRNSIKGNNKTQHSDDDWEDIEDVDAELNEKLVIT
ncbi:NAP1-binding protein 2 [Monosporozyma servazzii]